MGNHLLEQIQSLSARVQSDFRPASLLLVTSASRDDGTDLTSFGLAECLSESGYSVVLIDAAGEASASQSSPASHADIARIENGELEGIVNRNDAGLACISLAAQAVRAGLSLKRVGMLAERLRSRYDYAVIDAACLPQCNLALLFAKYSDAILIAVRMGRLPSPDDAELLKSLTRYEKRIFGVVAVDADAIADFDLLRRAANPGGTHGASRAAPIDNPAILRISSLLAAACIFLK